MVAAVAGARGRWRRWRAPLVATLATSRGRWQLVAKSVAGLLAKLLALGVGGHGWPAREITGISGQRLWIWLVLLCETGVWRVGDMGGSSNGSAEGDLRAGRLLIRRLREPVCSVYLVIFQYIY